MTLIEQSRLLESLADLAPTNPERFERLKELLSKPKEAELLQLDLASITWLIGIMIQAEKPAKFEVVTKSTKSKPYQRGTKFPTETVDAEDGLDGDFWGV